jgi:hypothetical protein
MLRHLVSAVLTVTLVLVWVFLMVAWFAHAVPDLPPGLTK